MSEALSKNDKEKNINESENLTVNDSSFNVRHKPHQISTEENKTLTSNLKDRISLTSTAISNCMDFSMEALLKQARLSFENFIDPKLPMDQRIPFRLFNDMKGMMFITVYKGGIGVGGFVGTGIIMAHNPNWKVEWSAPCAIMLGGLQIGLSIGVEKTDHIIFIRDENVITKFHSGVRLGGDISMSMGTLGRDTNVGVTLNQKGAISNVSYSMSKGAYIGIALEGAVITIRNDCNEKYFGHQCNVTEILNGSIKAPFNEDYIGLCKSLQSIHTPSNKSHTNMDELFKESQHPSLYTNAK